MTDEGDLAARYLAYLALCNTGRLDELGELVSDPLAVSGTATDLAAYAAAVGSVRDAFPDYHWEVRHLVVNPPVLAARLVGTGTHTGGAWLGVPATGRRVTVPEHAFYTWSGGRIREVWSVSDRLDTLRLLQSADGR